MHGCITQHSRVSLGPVAKKAAHTLHLLHVHTCLTTMDTRVLLCVLSRRSCAQQLVVAVAEAFEDSGALPAVLEGVVRRWAEADAEAAAGKPCWWQMREAGMLAASSCEATVSQGEPSTMPAYF